MRHRGFLTLAILCFCRYYGNRDKVNEMKNLRRWIMHVDMDAFFASVEQRDHPEWKNRPVIVGGRPPRGVVATASYEARAFGVRSAMPSARAMQLCPDAVFAVPRMDVYQSVCLEIRDIMHRYASDIEPISIDEAFLDITGMNSHFPTLGAIGRSIRKVIREETGLVASAGIAPNKFLAKLASDLKKPDGFLIIPYGKEAEILAPLPVRRIWGVGKATENKLTAAGYVRIKDLQDAEETELARILASDRTARLLKELSFGKDSRPLETDRKRQSIGDETTYKEDLTDRREIDRQIAIHADVVARRLRKYRMSGRTVSLKVRFASFRTVSRSMTASDAVTLQEEIYETAKKLLSRIPLTEGIRLLGVTVSNLSEITETPSLFPSRKEALTKAAETMDSVQEKYGKKALCRGFYLNGSESENK